MDYAELNRRLSTGRKIILVHGNADCDALGSAFAISRFFSDCDIYAPGGIERTAKTVAEKLNIPYIETAELDEYDLKVIVDCSSPEQILPATVPLDENTIVIDHHRPSTKWDGCVLYCDDTSVACAQIILRMIMELNVKIDKDVGLALTSAMLTDSRRLTISTSSLLKDFAYVMDACDIHMYEALDLLKMDVSMSERTASLKCVGRSKFERVGNMLVASSISNSFESSCCQALLAAGADVAFVGSQREGCFRVSSRATQDIVRRGVHLGETMDNAGTETENDGGGHAGAAGMTGPGDVEAMLHICVQKTMDDFRRIAENEGLREPKKN